MGIILSCITNKICPIALASIIYANSLIFNQFLHLSEMIISPLQAGKQHVFFWSTCFNSIYVFLDYHRATHKQSNSSEMSFNSNMNFKLKNINGFLPQPGSESDKHENYCKSCISSHLCEEAFCLRRSVLWSKMPKYSWQINEYIHSKTWLKDHS